MSKRKYEVPEELPVDLADALAHGRITESQARCIHRRRVIDKVKNRNRETAQQRAERLAVSYMCMSFSIKVQELAARGEACAEDVRLAVMLHPRHASLSRALVKQLREDGTLSYVNEAMKRMSS